MTMARPEGRYPSHIKAQGVTPCRGAGRPGGHPPAAVLLRRSGIFLAALAAIAATILPIPVRAAEESAAKPVMGTIREILVSKTPYYTNIEASIDGKIENYNSFKLNDPFRIVVDIWGVGQGSAASEIPAGTPQVKGVKVSQQGDKVRLLVETPEDAPLPFLVSAEGDKLVLSVGGGQEEKVTSMNRPPSAAAGPAVLGVDLEDLPDATNVVVTTSGNLPHEMTEGKESVTLRFPGATADKGLLRAMDARKFEIPVKMIRPSAGKSGVEVVVEYGAGSSYTVGGGDNTVVLSFPKAGAGKPGTVVAEMKARMVPSASGAPPQTMTSAEEPGRTSPARWGFVTHQSGEQRRYVGQRISLDFKDADLTNIFRIIAEVSNLNIITTDDVKGRVSIRLINVPWDQGLDIVLKAKNLGVSQEGNVLRIAPLAALRGEEKARLDAKKEVEKLQATLEGVVETISVNYAKASDMKGKISDLLSEGGKIQIDDRTNTIVIRDLRKNVEEVKALVASLDSPTPQVLIEARIVEVETTYARELGVQWGGSYHNKGSSTAVGVTGIQDPSGSFIPGQPLTNTPPYSPSSTPPNYAVNLPATVGLGSGGGISFGILRDNLRLDLSLSALEASGNGRVVSSPKVVTIDNREAVIEQGSQIPYSTVSASGTNVQFVDATLSLKVTPHITPEGSVIMKLVAKNDSPGPAAANNQPSINKKMATTEVLIRDGETAVIGGILQVSRKEDQNAVPWLSKIPILGYLFRKDTNTSSNRELLIFITPKILKKEPVQAKAS